MPLLERYTSPNEVNRHTEQLLDGENWSFRFILATSSTPTCHLARSLAVGVGTGYSIELTCISILAIFLSRYHLAI